MELNPPQSPAARNRPPTKANTAIGLQTPIQFVKGVGPKLGTILASRGFATVQDLIEFFPRGYQDRTQLQKISDLEPGSSATVLVRVVSRRTIPLRGGRRRMLEVKCRDDDSNGEMMSLRFFSFYRSMEAFFEIGKSIIVTGMVKDFRGIPQIVHPEVSAVDAAPDPETGQQAMDASGFGRIVPIYSSIDGIPSKTLRKIMWAAVEQYLPKMLDDLPQNLVQKYGFSSRRAAIRNLHFPTDDQGIQELTEGTSSAHRRLIYEEFLKFEYLILRRKLRADKQHAPRLDNEGSQKNLAALLKELPFQLTEAQNSVMAEILKDLRSGQPMNRLLQGDVGSGKTVVSFLAAALLVAEGSQAVMMAPTEILALQHSATIKKLLPQGFPFLIVTGQTKEKERQKILQRLKDGEPTLVIGTHAVFEGWLEFGELDMVIIDEQHRFGVEQRMRLRAKGQRQVDGKALLPHVLIMSATPIPRTLALTAYGDLDVSSMKGLPPGRSPIETRLSPRREAYVRILGELINGRQAYVIYPLVTESEAEGFQNLGSAIEESERLQREVFPQHRVGLLHGQLRPEEKDKVMAEFKEGKIHILVSTTVVEVGVDVPNASVMVIENAERFGLSQLHQLRGRVGRGTHQSYCHLVPSPKTGPESLARLEVMEKTNDGFKIAEADLEIRGPGEFLGTRQSGELPFKLANLVRDQDWLLLARDDAVDLLRSDPNLQRKENFPLRRYFVQYGKTKVDQLGS